MVEPSSPLPEKSSQQLGETESAAQSSGPATQSEEAATQGGEGGGGGGVGGAAGVGRGFGTRGMMAVLAWLAIATTVAVFVTILLSVFVPFVWPGLFEPSKTLLHQLGDTAIARGLITFLVAVSTVAIALFLTLFIVITPDPADVKERFPFGKEVFTALIGILGTIIGFYFGSGEKSPTTQKELAVVEMKLQPDRPKKNDEINLTASINGGRPPYAYTIRFAPTSLTPIAGQTESGQLSTKFKLPNDYDTKNALGVELLATDAADAVTHKRLSVDIAP
jgi:hypothetical protein